MLKNSRYAVAIAEIANGTNEIKIVDASSSKDALIKAIDFKEYEGNLNTIEDILDAASYGDLIVSKPIEVDRL